MKAPATSISFALLCFLLGLENASAFMGFSFGNLLFAVNLCKLPGKHCHINCHGPLAPKNFCDNQCTSSSDSSTRRLESSSTTEFAYLQGACDGFDSSTESYANCMAVAQANCEDRLDDSDATYVDGSNYADLTNYDGGPSSSNGSTPIASKLSFLPYMIAATVASMFLVLYVWKEKVSNRKNVFSENTRKIWFAIYDNVSHHDDFSFAPLSPIFSLQRKEQQRRNEDLLADDESFHGAVARRIEQSNVAQPVVSLNVEEGITTGYAMA